MATIPSVKSVRRQQCSLHGSKTTTGCIGCSPPRNCFYALTGVGRLRPPEKKAFPFSFCDCFLLNRHGPAWLIEKPTVGSTDNPNNPLLQSLFLTRSVNRRFVHFHSFFSSPYLPSILQEESRVLRCMGMTWFGQVPTCGKWRAFPSDTSWRVLRQSEVG